MSTSTTATAAETGRTKPGGTTRRRARRRLAAVAVSTVAVLAPACGSAEEGSGGDASDTSVTKDEVVEWGGEVTTGGTLVFAVSAESNTWDPASAQWGTSGYIVTRAIYDTLTTWNADGEAVPYLAESVEPTDDTLTEWHIVLRDGVTFHDGNAVDADAVAKSINHVRTGPTLAAAFVRLTEVVAIDDRTVAMRFNEPFGTLREALTGQAGMVVAPSMIDAGEAGARSPVGTGPFKFDTWTPNDELVVERNPDYWREGLPYLDRITFRVMADSNARINALSSGEIDMAEALEPGAVDRLIGLAEEGELQVMTNTEGEGSKSMMVLNTSVPPFDDVRVRRAMAQAVDRESISQVGSNGRNRPASGVFSEGSPFYVDAGYPEYDPAAAQQLVDEVEAEKGPIRFTFNTLSDPEITEIAQLLQSQLGAVGIDMEINAVDQTALISAAVTGTYEGTHFRLFGSPRPDSQFVFLHSRTIEDAGISLNVARLADPDIDAAIEKVEGTIDPEVKRQGYEELQVAMAESLPMIFVTRSMGAVAAEASVRGFDAWTLPDGAAGLDQSETVPMLAQVWLDR